MLKLLLLISLLLNSVTDLIAFEPESILLKNGNIITMNSSQVLMETDIRIKNGIIWEIGKNLKQEENERVIHLDGKYIIPALFDMHAHISVDNPWYKYQLALFKYFGIHDVQLMAGPFDLNSRNKLSSKHQRIEHLEGYPEIGYTGSREQANEAGLLMKIF